MHTSIHIVRYIVYNMHHGIIKVNVNRGVGNNPSLSQTQGIKNVWMDSK